MNPGKAPLYYDVLPLCFNGVGVHVSHKNNPSSPGVADLSSDHVTKHLAGKVSRTDAGVTVINPSTHRCRHCPLSHLSRRASQLDSCFAAIKGDVGPPERVKIEIQCEDVRPQCVNFHVSV
jgi:hypothetical protein